MKFHEEVILSAFIAFVLLPKLSKQMKPEDCTPLKQYWSIHFINENGTCAPCPPRFETCEEQGVDKTSCEDSCFVKSTITPLKPPRNPPYTPPKHSSVPSNMSTPANQPKKYKETTHFDDVNLRPWLFALVVVLGFLVVFLASIVVVVLLCIRKFKKPDETYGNMENGMTPKIELLQRNNEGDQNNDEEHAHVPNDIGGCVQVPNGGEGGAHVPNDYGEHPQEPNVVEGRAHFPDDAGPAQEQEPPFITQPTSSNRLIKEILEESVGSSLNVHVESHN